jgi:VCBS repeat-containing protein
LTYRPEPDYFGPDTISYAISDNGLTAGVADPKSSSSTVAVTVTEANDAPSGGADALASNAEDAPPRTIAVSALLSNDQPGPANESSQQLTISSVTNPVGGTAVLVGGDVIFTPTADYNGPAGFSYMLRDNGTTSGALDAKTMAVTVSFVITEVNDAPQATPDAAIVAEDSAANVIAVLANDVRGPQNESSQTLTVTEATAVHGTVTIEADGALRYTPQFNYFGPDTISYTITDNGTTGGIADPRTSLAAVAVTVTEVNDAPLAADDSLSAVAEDSPPRTINLTLLLNNDQPGAAGEEDQQIAITGVTAVTGGTVSLAGNELVFTPAADFFG